MNNNFNAFIMFHRPSVKEAIGDSRNKPSEQQMHGRQFAKPVGGVSLDAACAVGHPKGVDCSDVKAGYAIAHAPAKA